MEKYDNYISKRFLRYALRRLRLTTELSIPIPNFLKMRQDPVILLGMHRSGTTMLSNIFSDIGIHMGHHSGRLNEADFFLDVNLMLMELYHCHWDYPKNMMLIKDSYFHTISNVSNELNRWVNSFRFLSRYVGFKKSTKFYQTGIAWGWKEPRTTVTWPFWHFVFESAKFVFIYRNGIDVAESLRKAEINSAHALGGVHTSLRATTLQGAFEIWEEYNEIHHSFKKSFPSAKLLEVCYEDLLLEPTPFLKKILDFIGLEVSESKLLQISSKIDSSRRFSFLNDERLYSFYKKNLHSPWIRRLSYQNI